jgi:glycosyltransferase involved in cell wall biosynthesis
VETIHYGLDALPEAWGENPPDPVPPGARVLLAVSRLTRQKGVDVAVAALRELPDDTVLVVLGEGPERNELERLATELDVDGRAFLLGRVPDVAAWLERADVFVHPARWEGFGLAVLEAMLAGLPVVATDVSSLPELLGTSGLLVPRDDPGALARGAAAALERPELGADLQARARSQFSVARMADRTAGLYADLASASS